MPIVLAPLNVELEIVKVLLDNETKKRLESLGIFVGSKVTVLDQALGSTIVLVKEGRLALDKDIATKILVAMKG